jgi:ribosomal protein S18 acetylase RimI-like enzyme
MNIIIKLEKNIEVITKLNEYVLNFHFNNHPNIFNEYNYEIMFQKYNEYLNNDNIQSMIVYDNDEAVGYALFYKREYPEHIFKKEHSSIYIDQMCVKPNYQRKGIGKIIVNFIKEYCNNKNIKRIELSVWSDNLIAKDFYKKAGFENYLENMKIDL